MPLRAGEWLGGMRMACARFPKPALWSGCLLAVIAIAALSILGYQKITYRANVQQQGVLLSRIHSLEDGLDSLMDAGEEKAAEKTRLVHQLLSSERQLFKIRKKLRASDRISVYRLPLGEDVHQVLEELGKKGFIVPESFIKSVREQIEYFTKAGNRATLIRCFARKPRYEKLILRELARMKLPSDFLYIAMQESMFDTAALSPNDARGLWQMVPETAREHSLRVPEAWKDLPASEDERTHARLSTKAAVKYLRQLHSEFGDAALAMAAYNAGGGKIRKSLQRIRDPINDRDYWYLYRMGMMSPETRQFVPKIIAMILIDRNRAKYGFK